MGEKLKYSIYVGLFSALALLPFPALYGISDFLYWVFYRLIKYRLKVVRENLSSSFPEKSPEELSRIEKKFYHFFCDTIVETVKLLHMTDRQVERRIKVRGGELVEEIADRNRPVFLYLGHYGNWEWAPAISLHYDRPKTSAQIYKAIRDKAFDRLMLKIRSRFHSMSIEQHNALKTLFRLRKEEGSYIVGIIDDNRPNHDRSAHYISFLNHEDTLYSIGAEEIGKRVNADFLFLDVERPRRGEYVFTFKRIIPENLETDYPYTQQYMKMLEAAIRREPSLWLWTHKRWKRSRKNQKTDNSES